MQVRRRRFDRTVLIPGQVLTGRDTYRVNDVIGEGGYSVVYSAAASRDVPVAIKEFIPGITVTERQELHETYLHEREVLWGLRLDPHLPALVEAFSADGMNYLVQEFVPGESLQDRMNRLGPVPPSEVAPLVLQIARALTSLHSRNLVHHDVKPANVKQGDGGLAILLDLGSARFAAGGDGSPHGPSALRHLAMGAIAGTPGYMAPELREMVEVDDINSDRRLDIFALGCTIHQLVTNQALDQNRMDKRDQEVIAQAVSEITAYCQELATPAARALSYDLEARYATAQEMLHDLQQLVPPRLVVRESALDFDISSGRGTQERVIVITNAGGGTLSGTLSADHPGIAFLRPDGQKAEQIPFEGNACAVRVVADAAALATEREAHILVASSSGESTITCRLNRPTSRPVSLSVNPTRAELTVTRQTTQHLTVKLVNGGGEPGSVTIRASRAGIVHITPAECQLAPGERSEIAVRPLRDVRSGVYTLTIGFQAEPGGTRAEVHLTVRVRASLWHDLGRRFSRGR